MGTVIFLVAEGAEERFELGKFSTGWRLTKFLRGEFTTLPDRDKLAEDLRVHASERGFWEPSTKMNELCLLAADKILAWTNGRRIKQITEHDYDLCDEPYYNWPITGSRYPEEDA
jgi:hypothetical protein